MTSLAICVLSDMSDGSSAGETSTLQESLPSMVQAVLQSIMHTAHTETHCMPMDWLPENVLKPQKSLEP